MTIRATKNSVRQKFVKTKKNLYKFFLGQELKRKDWNEICLNFFSEFFFHEFLGKFIMHYTVGHRRFLKQVCQLLPGSRFGFYPHQKSAQRVPFTPSNQWTQLCHNEVVHHYIINMNTNDQIFGSKALSDPLQRGHPLKRTCYASSDA